MAQLVTHQGAAGTGCVDLTQPVRSSRGREAVILLVARLPR
jgi:hypothetical protein